MNDHKKQRYIPALSYDFLTPLYDPVVAVTTREKAFKSELVRQADPQPSQRILDLGCGTATLSIALKRTCPEASVQGLDGDPKILELARRKAAKAGAEIYLDQGLSFEMPYTDANFDTVVSSLFFHHLSIEDKLRTLAQVHRVLKPSGYLHIADWGRPSGFLMHIASLPVQWLDGETATDSYKGVLPQLISDSGFVEVSETGKFDSAFGTIRLHKAKKGGEIGTN